MKKIIIAVTLILSAMPVMAQGKYGADSADCVKNLSYYTEYYKQKNYKDAVTYWRQAYHYCPATASQNLLIHGTTLLKTVADKSKGAARAAVVDSILTLQDKRAQYYPKYKAVALNNKAKYAAMYLGNEPQKSYDIYQEVKTELGAMASGIVYENQFAMAMSLFKEGKMSAEQVMNVYTENSDIIEDIISSMQENIASTDNANAKAKLQTAADEMAESKKRLENMFIASKVASCDDLITLFTPRLQADPDNIKLVKNVVKVLNATEDCSSNDLYLKAVTTLNAKEPSAATSYYLYRMYKARGDNDKALEYLEEAASSSEITDSQKAEYTLDLARMCMVTGNKVAAVNNANKAISLNEANAGDAYMVIAKVWGSMRCGGDEIATKANFWVAVDYLQKAKAANPDLADEANSLMGKYAAYYPNTADAFMYNLTAGQAYNVSCNGLSAHTTVRTNK